MLCKWHCQENKISYRWRKYLQKTYAIKDYVRKKYPKYSNNTQNSTVRKQATSLWNELNILIETSQRGHSDDK